MTARPARRRTIRASLGAGALCLVCTAGTFAAEPATGRDAVARGRYLTHDVAMCVQCHTPRNADGTLDETRLFAGAAMPVASPFAGREWVTQAPAIAGLGVFNEDDEMSLLTTGKRRDGKMPKPPMPPFRLTPEDARAVIAYLRSLETGR